MLKPLSKNITWGAIPVAGVSAGTVFLLVYMLLTPSLYEVNPTLILRYFAALVLGSDSLSNDQSSILTIGILVHYGLSLLFTCVIAIVIHRWGLMIGMVGGGILGIALYLINLYTMTVYFEWFFAINSDVLLLSHFLFGVTAGGIYELFDHYDRGFEGVMSHEQA